MVASAYLKMLYPRRELESPDSIAGKTAIETDYAKHDSDIFWMKSSEFEIPILRQKV